MPDDGAVGAVLDAPESSVNTDIPEGESSESTLKQGLKDGTDQTQDDKLDGRNKPDPLRKRISDLRRQADSITDPAEKQRLLSDAKTLNDKIGKVGAYEQVFPTVREAREVHALLDSIGGREGFQQMQQTLSSVEEIDALLERGDPIVLDKLWEEAKQGMPKLVPAIIDRLAKESPEEYQKTITPHAVKFLDDVGYPEAFDTMVGLIRDGRYAEGLTIAKNLATWVTKQRQATEQSNPEVERLKQELQRRDMTEKEKADAQQKEELYRGYDSVADSAAPLVDKAIRAVPGFGKLGLSKEQMELLSEDVWNSVQKSRNSDNAIKTLAQNKLKVAGVSGAMQILHQYTVDNVQDAARKMVQLRYGHQLKAGTTVKTAQTAVPGSQNQVRVGKEPPKPADIDYGSKGITAARKAGFRDVGDMVLSGQAPLKTGQIYKWR